MLPMLICFMCFMPPLRIKRSTFFFCFARLDWSKNYVPMYVPTLILTFESNSHLSSSINCTFCQIFMQQSICSTCSTSTLSGIRLSLMPWTLLWRAGPYICFYAHLFTSMFASTWSLRLSHFEDETQATGRAAGDVAA